ncbi:MAG: rhomboid family intramembrane serine protease [Bacteroidaceae bacterium]|nr:rhomboid family intramembrane serine protease [Bacteroidaceae bacterium]
MNNTPTVTKNLIIINVLCFFGAIVAEKYGINLNDVLGLHYFESEKFRLYQLFTYMFMHSGFEHIFFNMFAVWMFGRILETVWGPQRFLLYYVLCGMGAGLVQEVTQYFEFIPYMADMAQLSAYAPETIVPINGVTHTAGQWLAMYERVISVPTVGASGAVYAILMAFGMLFPNQEIFIFPLPMPIKAKWLIIGYFVIELGMGIMGNDGVAHFAHLGGMIFGFLLILYWRKRGNRYGQFYR